MDAVLYGIGVMMFITGLVMLSILSILILDLWYAINVRSRYRF